MQQSKIDQEHKNLLGSAICLHPRIGLKSTITNLVTNVNKRHKGLTNTIGVEQTSTTTSFEVTKESWKKLQQIFSYWAKGKTESRSSQKWAEIWINSSHNQTFQLLPKAAQKRLNLCTKTSPKCEASKTKLIPFEQGDPVRFKEPYQRFSTLWSMCSCSKLGYANHKNNHLVNKH